jgi:hypothetical protein
MKIDGQCHCGQVTFEGESESSDFQVCHCEDCQVMGGSAFRANVTVTDSLFSVRGQVSTYVKTTARSGNRSRSAFCGNCGSPLYSCRDVDSPPVYRVRLGIIRQKAEFSPRNQIWKSSAFGWVNDLACVEGFEGNPT